MFFYYEMQMTGKWAAVLSPVKPEKKSAGSHTPRRTGPIKLDKNQQNLSIDQLCQIFKLPDEIEHATL